MCNALNYLHNLVPPIVHRDFTPHNLMMCTDGRVRLIDFNVAFQPELNTGKTIVGKRNYIPPEQFRGQASIESDIYALGGTLFFLLTGRDPEPLSQSFPINVLPELKEELNQIVARATALAIEERYRSVEELSGDLEKQSPGNRG
jgi:eukaryotic-like serine/threonine-protein kinase